MSRAVVVIPTYCERDNVQKLADGLQKVGLDAIFVDDNSPDGTGELLNTLSENHGWLKVIHRTENRGYGPSLLAGIKKALEEDYQLVLTMDADLSHSPAVIPKLIAETKKAEVIIGSRYVSGGSIVADWGFIRKGISNLGSLFAKTMVNLPVNDCTSGFRCYRASILSKLALDDFKSNGYSLLIELLAACKKVGASFAEVPITYVDRQHGKSKISKRIVIEAAVRVIKLRLNK